MAELVDLTTLPPEARAQVEAALKAAETAATVPAEPVSQPPVPTPSQPPEVGTAAAESEPFKINGALFKDTSDRRIDYSGTIRLTAQDVSQLIMWFDTVPADQSEVTLFLTGWKKTSLKGQNFISFVVQPPKGGPKGSTDDDLL